MLLDTHTHRPAPYPEGIISVSPDATLLPGQLYSVGLHPWYIPSDPSDALRELEEVCCGPDVAAVGETGLDSRCETPMWLQVKAFARHIELAEKMCKPLVIHCVRTAGEVAQMRRAKAPRMPWIIHGFRGKPSVLKLLLDAGCFISYGEHFNADSLRLTPPDRLLAETDESPLSIQEIIAAMSEARSQELTDIISRNMNNLFIKNTV